MLNIEKIIVGALASWHTTILGLFAFLTILGTEGVKLVDGDPATNANLGLIGAAFMAFLAALRARDSDKTSRSNKASD